MVKSAAAKGVPAVKPVAAKSVGGATSLSRPAVSLQRNGSVVRYGECIADPSYLIHG